MKKEINENISSGHFGSLDGVLNIQGLSRSIQPCIMKNRDIY